MIPEIWLPTCTFLTGLIWPLAVTLWTMSPLATGAFRYSISESSDRPEYQRQAAPTAASASRTNTHFSQVAIIARRLYCIRKAKQKQINWTARTAAKAQPVRLVECQQLDQLSSTRGQFPPIPTLPYQFPAMIALILCLIDGNEFDPRFRPKVGGSARYQGDRDAVEIT